MSALETYLKEAKEMKGIWHKAAIINTRIYMRHTERQQIINAINSLTDQDLLRLLWEVGLDDKLQQTVVNRSKELAKEAGTPASEGSV